MTQPTQPLRVLELCAGIGGFGLACEMVGGYEVVGQVEIDRFCQAVLAKHWPDVRRMGDIREVVGDEFGEIDIIVGGIPCQGNSLAGKRRGRDDPRNLWPDAARIIHRVKPRWVVVENVAGLLSVDVADPGQPGGVMGDILRDLAQMGYAASWGVWGATDVGAPHQRDRVFIVGYNATVVDANRRRCHGREGGASGGEQYAGISAGQKGSVVAETAGEGDSDAMAHADSDRRGDGAHQSEFGAERRRPANASVGREGIALADPTGGGVTQQSCIPDATTLVGAFAGTDGRVERRAVAARVSDDRRVDATGQSDLFGVGNVADPDSSGRGSQQRHIHAGQPHADRACTTGVGQADADRARLPQRDGRDATRRACAATGGDGTGQTQPRLGLSSTGVPTPLARDRGVDHAATQETGPDQVLSALRQSTDAEGVQRHAGVHKHLSAAEVLRPNLHGAKQSERAGISCRTQEARSQVSRNSMRDMWNDSERADTPSQQQSSRQSTVESDDLVRQLSSEMALDAWEDLAEAAVGVSALRSACAEIGYVPETLSALQEVWRSLSEQEAHWVAVRATGRTPWPAGPGAAQHAWEAPHTVTARIPNRAARLKALGNAIVPQQAAVLLAAIVTWDQMEATA